MKTTIKRSPMNWAGLCRILAIVPWLALSACGDGGGGGGGVNSADKINTDLATALNGFYKAKIGENNFISLLLPIDSIDSSSKEVQWYGWYDKKVSGQPNPTLFSGVLNLGVNGAAQSTSAIIRVFINDDPATGSASLSNASLDGFHANVPPVAGLTALDFDAVAATAAEYPLDAVASAAALAGQWSGSWSSEMNTYAATLKFLSNGGLSEYPTNFPCNVSKLSLVRRSTGNAFTASLVIPVTSVCGPWTTVLETKTILGIAFIHTLANASRRLEVMLLDTDGRGISFRGDLQP